MHTTFLILHGLTLPGHVRRIEVLPASLRRVGA